LINRNFTLLLAGQLISQVGDKFHMIALSFWVLKTTGSTAKMGMVLAASLIPSLIFGFISGAFIDRYSRKSIIVGTDGLRGIFLLLFSLLFYFEMMNFYVVIIMQVFLSINAAFFDPAIPSIIPQIVDKKALAKANSNHQFIQGFSTIAGAMLGGILIPVIGYFWIFFLNAISFLGSACFEIFIKIPASRASCDGEKDSSSIIDDLKTGYLYIFESSRLLVLLLMVMVIHFFVGSIEVIMPVVANAISETGERTLGFFQAAFGAGTILMAAFLSVKLISEKISGIEYKTLFGSVSLIGVSYILCALSLNYKGVSQLLFLVCLLFCGACLIVASVSFKTMLQKQIDNRYSGRVFAVAGSVGNAAIPAAMIIYGLLLDSHDTATVLIGSGAGLIGVSLISFKLYKEKNHAQKSNVSES
jgi:DHA3 family macrolide efflux protein-like MFS transporter